MCLNKRLYNYTHIYFDKHSKFEIENSHLCIYMPGIRQDVIIFLMRVCMCVCEFKILIYTHLYINRHNGDSKMKVV